MLYLKDQVFENLVIHELNRWATEIGAERSPQRQMLGGRMFDSCNKYGVKNILALWAYGVTRTLWFSTAPKDVPGQMEWCDKLASEYAKQGDIRLMPELTLADIKTMEIVWGQAAARLDAYAKLKKPVEPKLPTKIEEPKKNQEPEKKPDPVEPVEPAKKEPEQVQDADKKTMIRKLVGSIAGALSFVVDKIPIPLPIKYVVKIILTAIATFFK